jgi:hypothetical protein
MLRMTVAQDNAHLEELQYLLASMGTRSKVLPITSAAMKDGAFLIRDRWVDFAKGGPLQGVDPLKKANKSLIDSIKVKPYGPFDYEIYSESKIAEDLENGTPAYTHDMKETHPYGPRSRVGKNGPYLIVPFQWGTEEGTKRVGPKNIVPRQLLSQMRNKKKFAPSKVEDDTYLSPNQRGQMVERWTYTWGNRAGSEYDGTYAEGMVRFEQGEAVEKKDGRRYGGFFTFRVISVNSPPNSWIRKVEAVPARHVVNALYKESEKEINENVESAIITDMRSLKKGEL